jgi:hypothetical protein
VNTREWLVGCPEPGCAPRRAGGADPRLNPEAAGFNPFRGAAGPGWTPDAFPDPRVVAGFFAPSESDGHDSDASMVGRFVQGLWNHVAQTIETIPSESEGDGMSEPEADPP